jgi:hypothetical protein
MSDQILANLKEKLTMNSGPIDEGKKDNRNSLKTGSVVDWLTYPSDVYVTPGDNWYKGEVAVHFSGRERKADYKLGAQTDTNDHQTSGKVTAKYSIDRDDVVFVTEVTKHGGRGRVGDAVVRHVNEVNGDPVG